MRQGASDFVRESRAEIQQWESHMAAGLNADHHAGLRASSVQLATHFERLYQTTVTDLQSEATVHIANFAERLRLQSHSELLSAEHILAAEFQDEAANLQHERASFSQLALRMTQCESNGS